jgi:hypothetical protein
VLVGLPAQIEEGVPDQIFFQFASPAPLLFRDLMDEAALRSAKPLIEAQRVITQVSVQGLQRSLGEMSIRSGSSSSNVGLTSNKADRMSLGTLAVGMESGRSRAASSRPN